MATNTGQPNAKNPLEVNPNPINTSSTWSSSLQPSPSDATSTPDAVPKGATESKGPATMVAGQDASLSDVQKKKLRAERFGISVQMSEQEKRNSRAERFGTASTLRASEVLKSEELKRKARAERFGIPTAADEDAKKKARLARFAPVSKTDPLEEDKRKARALRFSNSSSSSLLQAHGNENIEPEAAFAGKAGGGV